MLSIIHFLLPKIVHAEDLDWNFDYWAGINFSRLLVLATGPLTLGSFAARVIVILLYIAGILALIFLIYAGILYITSGGNPDQAKRGQQATIYVIIGIIVIVLSLVIIIVTRNLALTL